VVPKWSRTCPDTCIIRADSIPPRPRPLVEGNLAVLDQKRKGIKTRLERSRREAGRFLRPTNKLTFREDITMTTETTETESLPSRHYTGLDPSINEPFVKPEVVADFLDLNDATVVRFANAGFLPGYPLRESGKRTPWRFLLSEIKQSIACWRRSRQSGSLASCRRPKQID
jgi:hypothetical protein